MASEREIVAEQLIKAQEELIVNQREMIANQKKLIEALKAEVSIYEKMVKALKGIDDGK